MNIWESAKFAAGYEITTDSSLGRKPYWVVVLVCLTVNLYYDLKLTLLDKFVCKRKGHDWVDESYGGPDSGYESGYCKRCGWSFHHRTY